MNDDTFCPRCARDEKHRFCSTVRRSVLEDFDVPGAVMERVQRALDERLGWTTALPDCEFYKHFRAVRRARQAPSLVPEVLARLQVVD